MDHELKTWPEHFEVMRRGEKTFEVRKNDRDFKVGDFLHLLEWNPKTKKYTGRDLIRPVKHILLGGQFGIELGYIVMSIGG
jgi:patatin-like phospholipase/acyl hydrolase